MHILFWLWVTRVQVISSLSGSMLLESEGRKRHYLTLNNLGVVVANPPLQRSGKFAVTLDSTVSPSPSVNSTNKDPKEYLPSAFGNLQLQMQKYCFWSLVIWICHWEKEPNDIRDQLYFWESIFKISYTWTHTVQIRVVQGTIVSVISHQLLRDG